MNRKVFMSFLGGGAYHPCTYTIDEHTYTDEQYIQVATLKYLTSIEQWDNTCVGYIFLTQGAQKANWIDEGIILRTGEQKKGAVGLATRLQQMELPFQIFPVFDVEDGNNEDEIFRIFDRVYNCLQEGDELYLDITHGFRYLPMLMVVLSNYSKFLKSVQVKSITYGNFEFSEDTKPIIQLLPLSSLQDWTFAAGQFVHSGDTSQLTKLCNETIRPLMKKAKGNDPNVTSLYQYIKFLSKVIDELRMCRGISIVEANSLRVMIEKRQNADASVIPPMSPILDKIQHTLDGFDVQGKAENGFVAAKWCLEHGLYQQASTILEESIITILCNRHGWDWKAKPHRDDIGKAFHIVNHQESEDNWELGLTGNASVEEREQKKQVFSSLTKDILLNALANTYDSLSQIRNDLNHAGFRINPQSSETIKKGLYKVLDTIDSFISPIFVNLSNHDTALWSPDQLDAAKQMGKIVDIPFPNIPPNITNDELESLAETYIDKIKSLKSANFTVHIMGEMNFTYAMVKRLREQGVACVASTTERVVEERDGQKVSTFRFVQFRNYE